MTTPIHAPMPSCSISIYARIIRNTPNCAAFAGYDTQALARLLRVMGSNAVYVFAVSLRGCSERGKRHHLRTSLQHKSPESPFKLIRSNSEGLGLGQRRPAFTV